MSDYKCDLCEKKATVHITKFVNGQKLKFHLCENCAKNHKEKLKALIETQVSFKKNKDFDVEDIISDMLEAPKKTSGSKKQCPHCKNTFEAFEKEARVPCEHCYETFSDKFDEILGQMHLSIKNKGKHLDTPKKAKKRVKSPKKSEEVLANLEPKAKSIEELSAELELAISQERYEDAAILRDKIKSLKS